jgi:hypothetical protein
MQITGQNPAIGIRAAARLRFQHHGARAIAKQNAGAAICPIHDAREGFGPDNQHALGLPGHDKPAGIGQRKDKPRTDGLNIEGETLCHAQARLNLCGHGGKGVIRGRGGNDHGINFTAP